MGMWAECKIKVWGAVEYSTRGRRRRVDSTRKRFISVFCRNNNNKGMDGGKDLKREQGIKSGIGFDFKILI